MRNARVVVAAAVVTAILASRLTAQTCSGDCDGNQRVTIDELLRGVRIALGTPGDCAALDADDDGIVAIDELLRAVGASLEGCGPIATRTPTPSFNLPPVFPTPRLYRAFPDHAIAYPIGVIDPNGDTLSCGAADLPDGAELEAESAVLAWTPREDQIGSFEVTVTCTDDADPPESAETLLTFQVSPLDDCMIPRCDPATGCDFDLPPPDEPCCDGSPGAPADLSEIPCPLGNDLAMSRDVTGFRPLRNCDLFRVSNMAQSGANVAFKLQARCVNTLNPVRVQIRMDSTVTCSPPAPTPTPRICRRPMVNFLQPRAFLESLPGGSTEPIRLTPAEVLGGTPFFDLQDAEANLFVTVRDSDGVEVTEKVRLLLTFTPIPAVNPSPTPTLSAFAPRG